jgi:hypothetical protein
VEPVATAGGSSDRSCSDSGAGADCGACCGYNAEFLAYGTIASATFCALVISGVDTISGTGAGMAGVGEDDNKEFGMNLRRFDAAPLSTTSSSLSRLRPRGLSVGGDDTMVGVTEWADIPHTTSSAFSNDGAANTGEDGEGEEVVEDGRGGGTKGRGVTMRFLTAASAPPHTHFSGSTVTQNTC